MSKTIPIFIISLKNNQRRKNIIKRLKEINVKFSIIKGIDGNLYHKKKKLDLIYNRNQTIKNINRELAPPEIGSAASHLKIYKLIIKKNIQQSIIMEDDAFPSKFLFNWIKNYIKVPNNSITSFYAYENGFLEKKATKILFNKKIAIHQSSTHIFNNSCYQINKATCQKIIDITKGKVCGFADWPFRIKKNKIKLFVTIPFLSIIDDKGDSYVREFRKNFVKSNLFLKKILPKKIINFLRIFYYLTCLPLFFKKNQNKDFYYEFFFNKEFAKIKNFFFNCYLDLNKIYFDKDYYWSDLKKYLHIRYNSKD
jgi:GR25 family glycosyltransferase involved in LPS biosynthesis